MFRQEEQSLRISYKKLKELQNRQITELSQMTPENAKLYNQISDIARQTPVDEKTQEEWILEEGKAIVQAQKNGESARARYAEDLEKDIFARLGAEDSTAEEMTTAPVTRYGNMKNSLSQTWTPEPEQYEENDGEQDDAEPPARTKRTLKWYIMIAWAAISVVLLMQGAAGLFMGWTDGDTEPFSHISLFTLIVAAVGGIALVETLRRLAERPDDEGADLTTRPQVNLRGIAIYIAIVLVVLFVGYPLRDSFPVFWLPPWVSLLIGLAGLFTLRPIFGNKKL